MGGRTFVFECARLDTPDDPYAFEFGPQDYTLRTEGGGREVFTISWNQQLRDDLTALRGERPDPVIVQRVGDTLRRALKPTGWPALAARILQAAAGDHVQVTIHSNAAEIYALPWELLTLDETGLTLGAHPEVLVRYSWPETHSKPAQVRVEGGGRILVAWSEAGGPVPDIEHVEVIEQACRTGFVAFEHTRDVVSHASTEQLVAALTGASEAGEPYVILHLLCHGTAIGQGFGLLLDDAESQPVAVDAARLAQLLAPFAASLRLVVLSACDSGNTGELGNRLGSVAQSLHRAGIAAVIASRYPLSIPGSIVLTRELYHGLCVNLCSLEQAFVAARIRLSLAAGRFDWASVQLYARQRDGGNTRPLVFRPYRGLLAFKAEHARFFFGRDAEVQEVLNDLEGLHATGKPRFLVVAGASGTGKSSVVLAGAVPKLSQGPQPRTVAVLCPGDNPMGVLEHALQQRTLDTEHFLLVVDQLEEIFTQTQDAGIRNRFIRRLWSLASGPSGIDVIVTVRVDFIGQCGDVVVDTAGTRLDRIAYDEAHRVFVAQMTRDQLRATIEQPAAQVGLSLQPGLADRILDDAGDEPGALPLMEYALDRLWLAREAGELKANVYTDLDGVIGALGSKADELIEGFSKAQQAQSRRLLTALCKVGETAEANTRRRRSLASLRPNDAAQAEVFDTVVHQLVGARLLVQSGEDRGTATLEVAHEALLRKWERLQTWLREDRSKLVELEKLAGWTAEYQSDGRLVVGPSLGYARDVLARYPDDIDAHTREMIEASQARMHKIYALVAAGALLVIALAIIAFTLKNFADTSAEEARKNEIAAKSSATAAQQIATMADQRALFARDTTRISAHRFVAAQSVPSGGLAYVREVETIDALRNLPGWGRTAWDALQAPVRTHTLLSTDKPTGFDLAFSPDGTFVAASKPDGSFWVWLVDTAELQMHESQGLDITPSSKPGNRTVFVTFSPNSQALLVYGETELKIYNVYTQKLVHSWSLAHGIQRAALRAGGSVLVAEDILGTVRKWEVQSGVLVQGWANAEYLGHDFVMTHTGRVQLPAGDNSLIENTGKSKLVNVMTGRVYQQIVYKSGDAAVAPNGMYVALGTRERVDIWNLHTGTRQAQINDTLLRMVEIDPKSERLYAIDDDMIQAFDLQTGTIRNVLTTTWHAVPEFSPDGTRALDWTGEDMHLQDLRTGAIEMELPDVLWAKWHPDGRRIVSATHRAVELWGTDVGLTHRELTIAGNRFLNGSIAADGSRVALTAADSMTRVWDAETSDVLEITGTGLEGCVDISPDGKLLVSCLVGAKIVNATTGESVATLGDFAPRLMIFDPTGRRLATLAVDEPNTVNIWNLAGELQRVIELDAPMTEMAFSGDGERIIVNHDAELFAWDVATGRLSTVTPGSENAELSRFTRDLGRYLKVDDVGVMRIYDTATGTPLTTLGSHDNELTGVAFNRQGTRVATCAKDHTARIWDTETGEVLAVLHGHTDGLASVRWSFDGQHILTVGADRVAKLWELTTTPLDKHVEHMLWTATPECPSIEQRVELRNIDEPTAELELEICQSMIECVYNEPADLAAFETCLLQFRGQQEVLRANMSKNIVTQYVGSLLLGLPRPDPAAGPPR